MEKDNNNCSPTKKRAKRNHFSLCEKQSVLNIFKTFQDQFPECSISEKVNFTAKAAGIGISSVYNIRREYKMRQVIQPPKRYHRARAVLDSIDEDVKNAIRRKVHAVYFKNESPTVQKILTAVNEDDDLPNFKLTTMRKLLKEINFRLCKPVDENIEEINVMEEENKINIEDFDFKRYILNFPKDQEGDDSISDIDNISCVKQEISIVDITESDNVNCSLKSQSCNIYTYKNNETVEKVKKTKNTSNSCDKIDDTTLNVSNINSNTNNDFVHKKSEEQSFEIIKKVDLKRAPQTPRENVSKPINQRTACILCAGSDSNNNKSIAHFAKLILDFSGVDILNTESPPIACISCFKQLKMVDNFKKQILYTNRLIMNATRTLKDKLGNDAGKDPRNYDAWEDSDVEAEDWFTFETTTKTYSKNIPPTRKSTAAIVNSNLNKKDPPPSINQEEKPKYSDSSPFLCAACGNHYRTMKLLKLHNECVHETRKHLCDICGNIFTSGALLKNHFRTHSVEKPFACIHCNKKFSLRWNLLQHKRLHTNNLPYKCKLCPASYRHNVTLKNIL